MLAFYRGEPGDYTDLGHRIASSLALFSDFAPSLEIFQNGFLAILPFHFGEPGLPPRRRGALARTTIRTASGQVAAFSGWFDNARGIASRLRRPEADHDGLYGAAVERWGIEAESILLGHYCSILFSPEGGPVRLARSPLAAPPLHYFTRDVAIGVSSVPRALVAMGLPQRLNRRKLADGLFLNPTEDEGYLEGSHRVGIGEVVELAGATRKRHATFDPFAIKPRPHGDPREYIAEADRLLTEAVAVALKGARNPGVTLSGGLDSPNVAARALRILPEDRKLKSFTFGPLPSWRAQPADLYVGDETGLVRQFLAMHPRIEPHFTDNSDRDFDTDLETMFLAIGSGQPNFPVAFRFNGLSKLAHQQGCDVLIHSDMGNATFSNFAPWAQSEYFRHGRWRQLWIALRRRPNQDKTLLREFLGKAVLPMTPDWFWRRWRTWRGNPPASINARIAFLHRRAMAEFAVQERADAAKVLYERDWLGYRSQVTANHFGRGDGEAHDYIQGCAQLYKVRSRDATAYRPLVEFCLSLPTEAYMYNGESRWLARELGRGILPEAIRTASFEGLQGSDWHERMTPRLAEFREELARARNLPELDGLIDFEEAERMLDEWPAQSSLDPLALDRFSYGAIRVIAAVRYARFLTGSNQ